MRQRGGVVAVGESEEHALGVRIVVGGAFAVQVGQEERGAFALLGAEAEPAWKDLAEAIRPNRDPKVRRNAAINRMEDSDATICKEAFV